VVDNTQKAERALEDVVKTKNYSTQSEHSILLYDNLDKAGSINFQLVQNGISVETLAPIEQDLEGYFLELMGGEHNA
jgi:ABC-2 type transport system ATP-binding protein